MIFFSQENEMKRNVSEWHYGRSEEETEPLALEELSVSLLQNLGLTRRRD